MKKVIINENQKGFLFRNGRFVKLLSAGKYALYGDREVEVVSLREQIISARCELPTLLANPEIARQASVIEVADQQLALHIVGGNYENILPKGRYAFCTPTFSRRWLLC